MDIRLTEIASGIHQLTTYLPEMDFSLNQFVVDADEPLLFHTGMRWMFPSVSATVSRLMPADRVRWIAFGHIEADECGSMNEWLAAAPQSTVVQGMTGCMVSIGDLADREPRRARRRRGARHRRARVALDRHAARSARVGSRLALRRDDPHPVQRRPLHADGSVRCPARPATSSARPSRPRTTSRVRRHFTPRPARRSVGSRRSTSSRSLPCTGRRSPATVEAALLDLADDFDKRVAAA